EPPRRFGRRQARARDRRLHLGEQALDVVAREEVALQAIVDHGPEPGPLLLAPPALERAARAELATVVLDDRPDLVHPRALERARGRARADEGLGRGGEARHARLVAQDAAAREGARRIDGEHGHLLPEADQVEAEGLDEGTLAHPGDAAHADAGGAARVGEE